MRFGTVVVLLGMLAGCGRVYEKQGPAPEKEGERWVGLGNVGPDCEPAPSDKDLARVCLRSRARAGRLPLSEDSYTAARLAMFDRVDPIWQDGHRMIRGIYTNRLVPIGESGIPRMSEYHVNAEHTWPQSRFRGHPAFAEIRSDLFHVFPTEDGENERRSNRPFEECGPVAANGAGRDFGRVCDVSAGYEPPDCHKGVAARAMFYVAVAYDLRIAAAQETVLREWHRKFPVSDAEVQRGERVRTVQGNWNPFLDHPEWVELVPDF